MLNLSPIKIKSNIIFIKQVLKMCRIILSSSQDLIPILQKNKDLSVTYLEKSIQGTIKSNSSHRSKYISNSRLTKNGLFSAIKGKKGQKNKETIEELNFQLELLRDAYYLSQHHEEELMFRIKNGLRICRQQCRRVIRGLEHYEP